MPPKTVTCSICSTEVLKAQTLARTDGTRACRAHEGVADEAEQRQAAERAKLDAAIAKGSTVEQWTRERRAEGSRLDIRTEQEAAEYRAYIYSHCWACAAEGLEWGEFWSQAMIASKRLQLRGEFNFMSYGTDVRKLMGNIALLAPIPWKGEITDRAVVKHLYKKVREIVPLIGFMLLCPACCTKHGFGIRFDELMPKPTWEQLEAIMPVTMAIDPIVTALAEKKERQS